MQAVLGPPYMPPCGPVQVLLVSGSGDGSVRLWDASSGRLLNTFVAAPPRGAAAAAGVAALPAACEGSAEPSSQGGREAAEQGKGLGGEEGQEPDAKGEEEEAAREEGAAPGSDAGWVQAAWAGGEGGG